MLDRLQVLVIENDDRTADLIFEGLATAFAPCVLEFTAALSIALHRLANIRFGVIFLDPLVANHGTASAIAAIRSVAPETPILLLLDRHHGLQDAETYDFRPSGCIYKDELKQRIWIERHIEQHICSKASSRSGQPVSSGRPKEIQFSIKTER